MQAEAPSVSGRADGNKLTKSINRINSYAFAGTGLENINLKDTSITNGLGNSVFQQATSLKTLELPSGLTTIPAGMAAGTTTLTSLNIPNSVTQINAGNGEFLGTFQGSGIQNIDLSGTALAT